MLGVGATANRQCLALSLDFSKSPVQLKVEVRDEASLGMDRAQSDGAFSTGAGAASLVSLGAVPVAGGTHVVNLTSVTASHYALALNAPQFWESDPSSDNNASLLIQALPSGQVVWTPRMPGYTGSGAGSLKVREVASGHSLEMPLYEARSVSTDVQLTTSLNYVWNVSISASGVVRATPTTQSAFTQPVLTLRLDATLGEWTGFYVGADRVRRNLFGVLLPQAETTDPIADGWIESGVLPGMRVGAWRLGQ